MRGFYGQESIDKIKNLNEGKGWDNFKANWKAQKEKKKQDREFAKEQLKAMFGKKNKSSVQQQKEETKYSREEVEEQYKLIKSNFPKIISKLNRNSSLKQELIKKLKENKDNLEDTNYTPLIADIFEDGEVNYNGRKLMCIIYMYCNKDQDYCITYGGVCPDYIEKEIYNIPGIRKDITQVTFGDGDEGCCYINIGPIE